MATSTRGTSRRRSDRGAPSRARLGDAVVNAVVDRGRGPTAPSLDRSSRAFLEAMEGRGERDPAPGERPRLAAMALATALCAALALGVAAWPAVVAGAHRARGTVSAGTAKPGGQAAATYAHQQVVGPGAGGAYSVTGPWEGVPEGGYPEFQGPIEWTGSQAATATWSLGPSDPGGRWDHVRVEVWVPGLRAGAWVRYTVTATTAGSSRTRSFDVAQQTASGWDALPGTFSIGTSERRTGSLTVRMAYLRPYTGPAADASCGPSGVCAPMAAGQVSFEWG